MLLVKALCHANKARDLCEALKSQAADPASKSNMVSWFDETAKQKLVQASKEFRVAAGIVHLIKTTVIKDWKAKPSHEDEVPLDLSNSCLHYLENLFLANAQQITVVVSYSKLQLHDEANYSNLSASQLNVLIQLVKGLTKKVDEMTCKTNRHLKDDVSVFFKFVFTAICCKLLAMNSKHMITRVEESDKESAKAVELIRSSLIAMEDALKLFKSLKSSAKGDELYLEILKPQLNELNDEIKAQYVECQELNEKVYFGHVSDFNVSETIRAYKSAFLPTLVEAQLPTVPVVSFEKKSVTPAPVSQGAPPTHSEAVNIQQISQLSLNKDSQQSEGSVKQVPEVIDPEFFNSLPPDIQQEIAQQQQQQQSRSVNSSGRKSTAL